MSNIGRMRHRLTIETRDTVPDGAGGETVTWVAGDTVWARIVPVSGIEDLNRDRFAGEVTHRITIRFRSDVAPEMRFRQGARIFEIVAARDLEERRRWLDCLCEEKYL